MLRQAHEEYWFYQKQIKDVEGAIMEQLLKQIATLQDVDISVPDEDETEDKKKPEPTKKKEKKNQFNFSVAPMIAVLAGVDLCKIPGISEVTALEFMSEVGTDMSKWSGHKQFSAWLNPAPNTKITGGKIISSKMMKK